MQNAAIKYEIYNPAKYLNEGFNYPIGVIGEECSDIWNAFINHIVNEDFDKYSDIDQKLTEIRSNLKAICAIRKQDLHRFFGGQIKWDDLVWIFEALSNAEYAFAPKKPY